MGRREAFGQTTVGVQKKACQDGGAVVGIGSVFDRGTYAHGMVAALMALLLVLQGLLVSGGTMAYALDGDSGQTGGDAVRTEVRDWSSDVWLSEHGTLEGGALGITPTAQLAWDGEVVAERQLTEAAFRALADDEEADVPATVTLSLKMDAPEGEVLLAGDTVSLSAQTDDGVVKLDDTAAAITLYEPDATGAATGRAVASANVAGGKLNITLLESAFDAEEEAVALGADANATTEDQAIADEAATDQAIADDAAIVDQATTEQAAAKSADVQEQAAPAHGDAVAMVGTFEAAVDASALSADGADAAGAQHDWTLLAWNGQALSKTTLVVPTMDQAVATLRDADALVEDKGADEGESEDVSLGKENGSVVLTDPAGGAASYELTGSTQATLTTIWCDNNDVNRPVAGSEYILCFTLTPEGSSESMEYRLPEDADRLGLDSTSLPAWATGVSTVRTETSTYVSTASDLPTTLAVTTGTDLGQSQTIYHIAWQLKDEAVYQDADRSLRYLRTAADDGSNTQYLQLLAEVEFHVVGHIGGAKPTDVFQEAQSANHGTKYDGAYPNGTMTLIHVGTTQFGNAVNAAAPDDADSDAYATVEPVASSDPAEGDSSDQAGVQQAFANELLTTSLAGTKTWDDYGSGIVARFGDDEVPELVLWRSASGQDADGASFSTEDEAPVSPTPTWTKSEDGLAWTYIYEGLPQVDEYGNPYTYWVEEARGSVPGFHPVYSEDHQATEVGSDKGEQTAVAFENVASRFALDKVSEVKEDDGSFIQLNDVELAVVSWTDRNVYAVWQRDTSGTEKSYVWPSGQSIGAVWPDGIGSGNANTEGSIEMTGANAGYIIGLPAGEYRIMESAPAPENHAMAEDVAIAIDWDGTVSKYDQNGDSVTNDTVSTVDDVTTVSVVDEVFRAHFNIHKTIERDTGEIDGLGDVTFELHRDDAATPEREGTLLAKGIVTGEDGDWESQVDGKSVEYVQDKNGPDSRFYSHLSDGLPPGGLLP